MENEILYPKPNFHFRVDWHDGTEMQCSEVSGLDVELDEIEYRYGSSPEFSVTKMSGLRKSTNVTLKKCIFKQDNRFFAWLDQVQMNTPKRGTVTINLMDETNSTVMVWTLNNAWPKDVSSPDIKADAIEVAIEEIEISHEGVIIEAPG